MVQIINGEMFVVGEIPGFFEFNRMTKVSTEAFSINLFLSTFCSKIIEGKFLTCAVMYAAWPWMSFKRLSHVCSCLFWMWLPNISCQMWMFFWRALVNSLLRGCFKFYYLYSTSLLHFPSIAKTSGKAILKDQIASVIYWSRLFILQIIARTSSCHSLVTIPGALVL